MTRRMMTAVLCLSAISFAATAQQTTLISGQPIKLGAADGVGPLTVPGISGKPLGAVDIFGGSRPDLVLFSDRWYPGLVCYQYLRDSDAGVPIFSQAKPVQTPFNQDRPSPGWVFQATDGTIYAIWAQGTKLLVTTFDKQQMSFNELASVEVTGLPRGISAMTGRLLNDGSAVLYLSVPDGVSMRPEGSYRSDDYRPYGPDGIWMGGLPKDAIFKAELSWPAPQNAAIAATQILPFDQGGILGNEGLAVVPDAQQLLFGSGLGGVHAMPLEGTDLRQPVVGTDGNTLRVPGTWANIMAYPSADGKGSDLIAACEGGVYYYMAAGTEADTGRLIYKDAGYLLQVDPDLYGGTLVVPTIIDWDGDGAKDIVAGNSQGFLMFFKNLGDNVTPRFANARFLEAGGQTVIIQGGYRGDIQGPGESRWGYTCPNVFDWNRDGLPDVLMNDALGMHSVMLNIGSATEPKLDYIHPLYLDDLDMHGTWRTRPGIGELDDQLAYVTTDDDDDFHLYWKVDSYNIRDGFKLKLTDGSVIKANWLRAGGTGRIKFELTDWDGDGKVDLIVGTPRHGSVPNPDTGLPWSADRRGSAVLLLKNVASNTQPSYEYPKLMHFGGQAVHLGQHSCAPAVADFSPQLSGLIVGVENGRLLFYDRKDITWP
ncbi:MAG: VCBS repeat-containing protein [Phycisphaeraceae bacterium]|nr:VCBS repeat-containing protein [Phycisphaeraceae bacterium]